MAMDEQTSAVAEAMLLRLDRTEAKLAAVNGQLVVMLLCLFALVAGEGYRIYQQQQIQQQEAAVLKSASALVGQQLQAMESSYDEAVYHDPESEGVMHQMFRVMEFQYAALKMIVFQNQLLLASQSGDPQILTETARGYSTEVTEENVPEP